MQRWIGAPTTVQKYFSDEGTSTVSLEDDSGRITLIGSGLGSILLVTGCIVAVMGTENVNGEFEVIDIKFPDLAPQPERWALSKPTTTANAKKGKAPKRKDEDVEMADSEKTPKSGGKIAIVSGLEFSGTDTSYAMELDLLLEYLLGEALDPATQSEELSHISRLIIAGNSIAADRKTATQESDSTDKKAHRKYGYDSSSYNAQPSHLFDEFLNELLPSLPVTLLPGALDPANSSYPQQPIHTAMFPKSRSYSAVPGSEQPGWFDATTNPLEMEVEGWRVLGTGGQNVDDMAKYVDSDDRLGMMEAMCRWRCSAPTAPDTLCKSCFGFLWRQEVLTLDNLASYPFQDDDPFVMMACPHLYFVGCQPSFGTKVITGPEGQMVRLITVPSFSSSREIVLVDTETLDVSRVKIAVVGSV
jgi:DNA polymerase delta subunit 2